MLQVKSCNAKHNSESVFRYFVSRLKNSLYFCEFKYTRVVKQKVWDEAENGERDLGVTLTPPFTDFFTDFEKTTDSSAVYFASAVSSN